MFSVPPLFLLIRDSQKDLLEVKSALQLALYVQYGVDGLMSYVMWLDVTRS